VRLVQVHPQTQCGTELQYLLLSRAYSRQLCKSPTHHLCSPALCCVSQRPHHLLLLPDTYGGEPMSRGGASLAPASQSCLSPTPEVQPGLQGVTMGVTHITVLQFWFSSLTCWPHGSAKLWVCPSLSSAKCNEKAVVMGRCGEEWKEP
jgi:hypothetical protein